MRIMSDRIVHPWFRPLDPDDTSPRRRPLGFVLLAVGVVLVLLGDFVPFGRWLFAVGSCLYNRGVSRAPSLR